VRKSRRKKKSTEGEKGAILGLGALSGKKGTTDSQCERKEGGGAVFIERRTGVRKGGKERGHEKKGKEKKVSQLEKPKGRRFKAGKKKPTRRGGACKDGSLFVRGRKKKKHALCPERPSTVEGGTKPTLQKKRKKEKLIIKGL